MSLAGYEPTAGGGHYLLPQNSPTKHAELNTELGRAIQENYFAKRAFGSYESQVEHTNF